MSRFDSNDPDNRFRPFDPTLISPDYEDFEELHPPMDYELEAIDWATMISRGVIILIFLIAYILVFVNVARGNKLKNWRLYSLVALTLFCWLSMAFYQDHIDEYFVHKVTIFPAPRSIYWCVRNLLHGITLFMIVLLLCHLSDFQHRGIWILFVSMVVCVPLLYSIAVLIIDLRVPEQSRRSWEWNIGIAAAKTFLYNLVTSIILFVFTIRFCTSRLYGTYEERRSTLVVVVSRWVFAFFILHNLIAIASFGTSVAIRVPGLLNNLHPATLAHRILDEIAFLVIVLAIPVSYLFGVLCSGCCGRGRQREVEMDKMDKIYQEVWSTNGNQPRKGRNGSVVTNSTQVNTDPAAARSNRATHMGSQLNVGSTSVSGSVNGSMGGSNLSINRRDNTELSTSEKRKKRESYLEAMSMGSIDERTSGRSSVTRNNSALKASKAERQRLLLTSKM